MNRNLRLSSGTFAGLREIGGFGQPLHALYPQIQAVLAAELGPDAAWLLAEPVVDRGKNRIDWYADTDPDQTAIALADLSDEQRQAVLARVDELLRQGRELADRYEASDDARRVHLGTILNAVLDAPPSAEIFLVEDKPVLTGWGFMADGPWAAPDLAGSEGPVGVAPLADDVGLAGGARRESATEAGWAAASLASPAIQREPPAIVSGASSASGSSWSALLNDRFMSSRTVWLVLLALLLLLLLAAYWLWNRASPTRDGEQVGSSSVATPVEAGRANGRDVAGRDLTAAGAVAQNQKGVESVVPAPGERGESSATTSLPPAPETGGPSFSTPPGPPAVGSSPSLVPGPPASEPSSALPPVPPVVEVEPRAEDSAKTAAVAQPPALESGRSPGAAPPAAAPGLASPNRTPASEKSLEQVLTEQRNPAVVETLQRELAAHPPVKIEPTAEERREFASRMSESGAASGEITVTLLWNSRGDLDLVVRCPSGQQLDFRAPTECDGKLDVDANTARDKLSDRPMENAFWSAGKAGAGTYQILVRYMPRKDEEQLLETPFQVRLSRGRQEAVFKGTVRPNSLVPVTTFNVGR
ncbi:MAG: hypothetical protein IPN66_13220 [Candidatus Competibacteraceae bacterium]|nr:hypothetical protein [Candidatus Competibacteraceae bacterium]MBK8961941.1 hypothetical protein [Candidatus Competibacteraceae bacterium]